MGMDGIVKAPRGGHYNYDEGVCEPAGNRSMGDAVRQKSQTPRMSVERPHVDAETTSAFVRSRERFLARLDANRNRDMSDLWRNPPARDTGMTTAEEIAKLQRAHRRSPSGLGASIFQAMKTVGLGALRLPFGLLGAGCVMRPSPYHGIGTPCNLVKIDLSNKAMVFRVLARNQIEAICRANKLPYISKTVSTPCRGKHFFEDEDLTTNPNWLDGMARAVFDAVGQHYLTQAINYEVRDWRPHVRNIPVYFENCSVGKECAASLVVCLDKNRVKLLTKTNTRRR